SLCGQVMRLDCGCSSIHSVRSTTGPVHTSGPSQTCSRHCYAPVTWSGTWALTLGSSRCSQVVSWVHPELSLRSNRLTRTVCAWRGISRRTTLETYRFVLRPLALRLGLDDSSRAAAVSCGRYSGERRVRRAP